MSKKLKFFVSTLAIAAVAVFSFSASNALAYTQTTTLKMGMSNSSQVMALQQALNLTSCKVSASGAGSPGMESTYFGSKTKAAVQCFQAANGLTADGVVGPMTGAALAAVSTGGSVSTTLPAGCTSTTGYSTVNGSPCSGTPSGVYPAGCTSSVGYSSTTGQPCNSSTGASTTGPLSINNVSAVSGYLNTTIGVGEQDKPVADLRVVTGAGGTGTLTGINISFYNFGTGDYQFTKYAQNVGVWLNGVKVGSLDASQFAQYNSIYSAFIPASGAMLNANSTNDLKISVTALPVIDSNNYSADNWSVDVTSIRYSDSTGVFTYNAGGILTSPASSAATATTSSNTYFSFASAASAQSIKLTVTKNVNDTVDRTVSGSSSGVTQGVQLAMVDLNAQGSAINVRRLPVTITVGNNSSTTAGYVVNTLRLYDSTGNLLDSEPVLTSVLGAQTVTFQNLNLTIPAASTSTLTVKGDFNTVGGSNFTAGAYAEIDVTTSNVGNIQAYDSGSNVLSGSTYLTGSTTGSKVYMYVNGISVAANGTPSASAAAPGGTQTHSTVSFSIPFSVTAFGATAYIPSTAVAAASASTATAIQFCVDNATGACQAVGNGVVTYTGSDSLTVDGAGNYQIPVGQTKTFLLQITYTANGAASYRASLLNVPWNTTDSASAYSNFTSGLSTNAFKTPYVPAS